MFQQLKVTALKCDTHYWECQGEKTTTSGWNRQATSSSAPAKSVSNLTASSDAATTSHTNPGIGVDGKLTQEEQEHCCPKGLCYYCSITINLPTPNCCNSQHPKPATAVHTTFSVTGDPEATIEEVAEGPPTESE